MTSIELLKEILSNNDAKAVLAEILVELMRDDVDVRKSVVDILKEDVSFSLGTDDYYDYDYSGYRISLDVDNLEVASTTFSVRNK